MAYTDSELLEKVDAAIEACLLGQDVMFEGQRITQANLLSLFTIRDRLQRKVRAASGQGMIASNVGIPKRN